VLPGIQAAFVDIGTDKAAFLHASDLVTAEEKDEDDDEDDDDEAETAPVKPAQNGRGKAAAPQIQDALKRGQEILVQVSKEPISTKGPRVTAQISLAGRFLVTCPSPRAWA
jgi:ribonuclease G